MESNRKVTQFSAVVLVGFCTTVVAVAVRYMPENPIAAAITGIVAVMFAFAVVIASHALLSFALLKLLATLVRWTRKR